MRKFSVIIIFFAACLSMSAYNPLRSIFESRFGTSKEVDINSLLRLVGDTVYFDTQSSAPLGNVVMEHPDTIWLKEKRAKKPKLGKDYALSYAYMATEVDGQRLTLAKDFNMKPFGIITVKELVNDNNYSKAEGYVLTLMELGTADVVYVVLDKSLNSTWRMYSNRANHQINSLINTDLYVKEKYSDKISPYKLTEGELYIEIEPNYRGLKLKPKALFALKSDSRSPINLTYTSSPYDYLASEPDFVTKQEYDKHIEKTKVYTIDYSMRKENTLYKSLPSIPEEFLLGRTRNYSYISQTIEPQFSPLGYKTSLPADTWVFIGDKLTVRGTDYYKAVLDGKAFYIDSKDVSIDKPEVLDALLTQPQEIRDQFFDNAKILSYYTYLRKRLDSLEAFDKMAKQGIVVLEAHPYDMSEYTEGTGMRFSILNTSDKTIKYITFNYTGYNAVDDPVWNHNGTKLSAKGIGPIEPYEEVTYTFDYVWFTDIVEYAKLRSIVVQYKNGTSHTFTDKAIEIVDDNIIDALKDNSPVKNLLPHEE